MFYFSSLRRRTKRISLVIVLLGSWVFSRPVLAQSTSPANAGGAHSSAAQHTSGKKHTAKHSSAHRASRASRVARTHRIKKAFVASKELEPMAQQLATLRTPEAYAAVAAYAHSHDGDAAAAAYLALGHAYLLDKRFTDAQTALAEARRLDGELADYSEFLDALASHQAGNDAVAVNILHGFTERFPDSIFDVQVPELESSAQLALGNKTAAREALAAAAGTESASRPGFELAEGQVELALNAKDAAIATFRHLLAEHPLTAEAQTALAKLNEIGAVGLLTTSELRSLGDAYYDAGRYADAADEFRALLRKPGLDPQTRNGFAVSEAACELKLKRLAPSTVQALPDTPDENGAHRLELLMELARDRDDDADVHRILGEMETRFPHSKWLADALFSAGNMHMLKRDYPSAIEYYGELASRFPNDKNASAAHWRSGWFSYRLGQYPAAARIFDEQIRLYPGSAEAVSALYWRARLYETLDRNSSAAAANYRSIVRNYQHFFYAQLARRRLAALGQAQLAAESKAESLQSVAEPHLIDTSPEDSPHLAKARLLANAGLNEYIEYEIKADPQFASMSALAAAQIYASYGETFRAVRAAKRGLPNSASLSIESVPLVYWRILFPQPWWSTIQAESAKNNLDPYLVASLIRQESEFDSNAVSYANAWGLMQILPSSGKTLAREEGIAHFQTFQLLNPNLNIRLGTRYLRELLDKFGGVQEYALAAYNAGDNRVTDWKAAGPYSGIDEFVESIPFTQTREYVEAILRNEEIYREIDEYARTHAAATASVSQSAGSP